MITISYLSGETFSINESNTVYELFGNIIDYIKITKPFISICDISLVFTQDEIVHIISYDSLGQRSAVENGQRSAVENGQRSAVENGQRSAVENGLDIINYDSTITNYTLIIKQSKYPKMNYYYNGKSRNVNIISYLKNYNIHKLLKIICTSEDIDSGFYILILKISNDIIYQCNINVIINEYWCYTEKEYAFTKSYNITHSNLYDFPQDINFSNVIFNLELKNI